MHELIIQICFVVAGTVTGCTDGVVQTDNQYLSSQDISPVYVHDAPQCVNNYYGASYTPSVTIRPRQLSWPTYTSHHTAHPWCTHAYSHHHGERWFTWKKNYSHWGPKRIHKYRSHKHHAHNRHASHGHRGHHKKSKVVVVKPKVKVSHRYRRHNTRPKVVIKPRVKKHNRHNKYKGGKPRTSRASTSQVVVKPRKTRQHNWRRDGARPKLNIPKNSYRPEAKQGKKGKKGNKRRKKHNNRRR